MYPWLFGMKLQRKNRKRVVHFFLNLKYPSPPTQCIGNQKRKLEERNESKNESDEKKAKFVSTLNRTEPQPGPSSSYLSNDESLEPHIDDPLQNDLGLQIGRSFHMTPKEKSMFLKSCWILPILVIFLL